MLTDHIPACKASSDISCEVGWAKGKPQLHKAKASHVAGSHHAAQKSSQLLHKLGCVSAKGTPGLSALLSQEEKPSVAKPVINAKSGAGTPDFFSSCSAELSACTTSSPQSQPKEIPCI